MNRDAERTSWYQRTDKEIRKLREGAVCELRSMTREDHIRRAEELVAASWRPDVYVERAPNRVPASEYDLALAQVHATLAVAKTPQRSWWSRVTSR